MTKYNLYKIIFDRKEELINKLESTGLVKSGSKTIGNFSLDFYFSPDPEPISIWWTETYKDFLIEGEKPKNKIYFAVLIIYSSSVCYAISLGKSHFYLKNYCDLDFGLNLAERIASEEIKIKNSKFYKSRKNKIITTYQEGSGIDFESGESMHYLKTKTIDKLSWGEVVSFGHSAQFSIELKPVDLPNFINKIEKALAEPQRIKLPKVDVVQDEEKQKELDNLLVDAISNTAVSSLQTNDITLSGVEFIFSDQHEYSFYLTGDRESNTEREELNIENLKKFIADNEIDLKQQINKIRIKVYNENGNDYSIVLKEAIDFIQENDRFCLIDGKWYQFNQSYIQYLQEEVDKIKTEFGNSEVIEKEEDEFNKSKVREGFINCDKILEAIGKKYKVEKMDLYKDKVLYYVKMGSPQKMTYNIDQSINVIKLLQNNQSKINVENKEREVGAICLWFILDRKKKIGKLSDINSIILHMKLVDWKKIVRDAGYESLVRVDYKSKIGAVF